MNVFLKIAFVGFVLISCKHEPVLEDILTQEYDSGTLNNLDTITCDQDTVYFQNSILPLLISNCSTSECHDQESAEDGVVLTSYSQIMSTGEVEAFNPWDSEIYEAITEDQGDDDFMPPSPNTPLSTDQIQMIYTWISQGALDNFCAACDTSQYTYSLSIKPIIDLKCKGCHSGSSPDGDISLENYVDLSEFTSDGILLDVLDHSGGDYSNMPPSGGQISDCEIQVIQNWINNGALDD